VCCSPSILDSLHCCWRRRIAAAVRRQVLIVGAGNSGCYIAVGAIHHGAGCDISMRRGHHFVPKHVIGNPAETGGAIKLPMWLKRRVNRTILKWLLTMSMSMNLAAYLLLLRGILGTAISTVECRMQYSESEQHHNRASR
jgi:hypothetical protein